MEESAPDDTHSAHKNIEYSNYRNESSQFLLSLLNKYVKVESIKGTSFTGFIHSIDPQSFSVILSKPLEDTYQTILILGHAVKNISEEIPAANVEPPSRMKCNGISEKDILARKARVIAWFSYNLLPVTEYPDRIELSKACILPPYTVADIYAENTIITTEIRRIMENMPENFSST